MAIVYFVLNKNESIIHCSNNDKMKDICDKFLRNMNLKFEEFIFIHREKLINLKLTLNEQIKKEDNNKITIFCISINDIIKNLNQKEINLSNEKLNKKDTTPIFKIKSKEIKCPECGEICKIKFNNFKITLYGCINGHKKENISLEDYNQMQYIDKSKIKCHNCKEKTKKENLDKCLTCNKDLCMPCKDNINKLNEYDIKNYICNVHNQKFNSYCNKCKKNLCLICEKGHKKEDDLILYRNIMPIINNEENKEMKLILERFNNDIKEIIGILNKTMDKIKLYSKIYSDYIDDFDENFINYQILNNFNELSIYNKKVINEMNQIINEIRIDKKINSIINLYNRFTENDANIIKYKINNL